MGWHGIVHEARYGSKQVKQRCESLSRLTSRSCCGGITSHHLSCCVVRPSIEEEDHSRRRRRSTSTSLFARVAKPNSSHRQQQGTNDDADREEVSKNKGGSQKMWGLTCFWAADSLAKSPKNRKRRGRNGDVSSS